MNQLKSSVLAVIPARGGSKGLPGKNLKELHGRSLVRHAIKFANSSPLITEIVITSDSTDILNDAKKENVAKPIFYLSRPDELASDETKDAPVLRHALESYEDRIQKRIELIAMLQPTSPLRLNEDVESCINVINDFGGSSAWTISEVPLKYNYRKQFHLASNFVLTDSSIEGHITRRQDLEVTYIRNGLCYVYTRQTILEDEKLRGKSWRGVMIDRNVVNIDSQDDFEVLEQNTTYDGSAIRWKL
jgi:CMP-N,N'-diacetyllegionaminic acid synthase